MRRGKCHRAGGGKRAARAAPQGGCLPWVRRASARQTIARIGLKSIIRLSSLQVRALTRACVHGYDSCGGDG